jgi:hypothetical protein
VTTGLIDCNREFSRMFQFGLEEARGRKINELIVPAHLADEGNELSRKSPKADPCIARPSDAARMVPLWKWPSPEHR